MWKQMIFLIISLFFSAAYATASEEALPAEQAFALSAEINPYHQVILHWKLAPGYYLYRDKLTIVPATSSRYKITAITLPAGEERTDALHGLYQAYIDQLSIPVTVQPPLKGKLELVIRYQGCSSAGFCYAPIKKYLTVDLSQLNPPQD